MLITQLINVLSVFDLDGSHGATTRRGYDAYISADFN